VDVFAQHFSVTDDELRPTTPRGEATAAAYKVNAVQKRTARSMRANYAAERLEVIAQLAEVPRLLKIAAQADDPLIRSWANDLIIKIGMQAAAAEADLVKKLRAIPQDAPSRCRCGSTTHHSLSALLEFQTKQV